MSNLTHKMSACHLEVSKDELKAIYNADIDGLCFHVHESNDDKLIEEYVIDMTEVRDWHNNVGSEDNPQLEAALFAIDDALDPTHTHNLRQYGLILLYCEV
jgi:pyruvate formate-lyase activating enzyme-like uncharacterized protein